MVCDLHHIDWSADVYLLFNLFVMVTEKELKECDITLRREFSRLMNEKLKERKMSKYQLAKEVAVNLRTIKNIDACSDCLRSTMVKIARVLDISIMII